MEINKNIPDDKIIQVKICLDGIEDTDADLLTDLALDKILYQSLYATRHLEKEMEGQSGSFITYREVDNFFVGIRGYGEELTQRIASRLELVFISK